MKKILLVLGCILTMSQKKVNAQQVIDHNNLLTLETPLHYYKSTWRNGLHNLNNVYSFAIGELYDAQQNFKSWFKYNNKFIDINYKTDTLNLSSIDRMLIDIVPSSVVPSVYNFKNDYSCIRIHYGMKNGKFIFVYEPVFLVPLDINKPASCKEISTGKFYISDGKGGLVSIKPIDKINFEKEYEENVWIQHFDDENNPLGDFDDDHKFHRASNYYDADTKSSVIPIQQLLKMYFDNNTNSGYILFDAAANDFYRTSRSNIPNYKVHIIASTIFNKASEKQNDPNSYQGLAADFSQQCPPSCPEDNQYIHINVYDN